MPQQIHQHVSWAFNNTHNNNLQPETKPYAHENDFVAFQRANPGFNVCKTPGSPDQLDLSGKSRPHRDLSGNRLPNQKSHLTSPRTHVMDPYVWRPPVFNQTENEHLLCVQKNSASMPFQAIDCYNHQNVGTVNQLHGTSTMMSYSDTSPNHFPLLGDFDPTNSPYLPNANDSEFCRPRGVSHMSLASERIGGHPMAYINYTPRTNPNPVQISRFPEELSSSMVECHPSLTDDNVNDNQSYFAFQGFTYQNDVNTSVGNAMSSPPALISPTSVVTGISSPFSRLSQSPLYFPGQRSWSVPGTTESEDIWADGNIFPEKPFTSTANVSEPDPALFCSDTGHPSEFRLPTPPMIQVSAAAFDEDTMEEMQSIQANQPSHGLETSAIARVGRLKCVYDGCRKKYKWPKDLRRHVECKHLDIKYPCSLCPQVLQRQDGLLRHLHNENLHVHCRQEAESEARNLARKLALMKRR